MDEETASLLEDSILEDGIRAWKEKLAVGSTKERPEEEWPWVVQVETSDGILTLWSPHDWTISPFNPYRTITEHD